MICGLDFGTSNCSIGVWKNGAPVLLPISGSAPYMPSVAYAKRREYASIAISDVALNRRVEAALRAEHARRAQAEQAGMAYHGLDENQLARRERSLLLHEEVADSGERYSSQTLADAILHAESLTFGEQAIQANNEAPGEGFYFKSPKLFLGTELHDTHLQIFHRIITAMIREVRVRAEKQLGHELKNVAIGHPVRYKLGKGKSGLDQALDIMRRAATDGGFSEVCFLPEPFAAALNYEKSVSAEETVLVVDIGGGTTDCAVISVGPKLGARRDRTQDVLSYAGDRIGGVRMDYLFAWHAIMPHLGKNTLAHSGLPIPHDVLIQAISIDNIPAQERFRNAGPIISGLMNQAVDPTGLARLYSLWEQGLQFRLIRSAEEAKIELSNKTRTPLPLRYLDSELELTVTQEDLLEAVEGTLERIGELAREASTAASAKIDKIFLTGGASRSPAVVKRIVQSLGIDVPIVRGDDLGSVGMGLTQFAQNSFG